MADLAKTTEERYARAVQSAREHLRARDPAAAERAFRAALQLRSGDALALSGLGHCLRLQQREHEAVQALKAAAFALQSRPVPRNSDDALLDIAFELQEALAPAASLVLVDEVLARSPTQARAWHQRARALQRLVRIDEALVAARRATMLAPTAGNAQLLLGELEHASGGLEAARARLHALAEQPSHPQRARALRLLGAVHDTAGRHDEAFACMREAGCLMQASAEVRALDAQAVACEMTRTQAQCDASFFDRYRDTAAPTTAESPVFLLGYLRSGTTLLEQAFSAHPAVTVTNETALMPAVLRELQRLAGGHGDWSAQVERLGPAGLAQLRACYWAEAAARFELVPGGVLLDKTAMNTLNIGLISLLFPHARAIFALRDPRDVCVSCFMQPFELTPVTVPWLDWESGARAYAATMSYWRTMRERVSLRIVVSRYEDLVSDLRGALQAVLAACEMDWDDACERYHEHHRRDAIRTPSFAQAILPVYTRSVGRWRHYAGPVEALGETLSSALNDFGYAASVADGR